MEHEKRALLSIGDEIKKRFGLAESGEEIWEMIDSCRKPHMEARDVRYIPVRDLIASCLREILDKQGMEMGVEDEKWIKELYIRAHEDHVRLAKNALPGLKELRSLAWHMGVISDADSDYLMRLLKSLKILDFFDSVTSSEEAGVGKPNPEIFRKAIEKAGNGDLYYHIGDSERRDIAGAKRLGLIAIKISRESDRNSEADYVAEDLHDAAMWIRRNVIKERR